MRKFILIEMASKDQKAIHDAIRVLQTELNLNFVMIPESVHVNFETIEEGKQ